MTIQSYMLPKKAIRVAVKALPTLKDLDFSSVQTLDQFLLSNLVGGGTHFSWAPVTDLVHAKAATHDATFQTWRFEFHSDSKFSDGSPLLPEHWYYSILRQIKLGSGVHFNPRIDIVGGERGAERVDGLTYGDHFVQVKLKKGNPSFLRLVGKPEASILPVTKDLEFHPSSLFERTSGPYFLGEYSSTRAALVPNQYYPNAKQILPLELLVMGMSEAVEKSAKGEIDMVAMGGVVPTKLDTALRALEVYRLFGLTLFFSFRSTLSPSSPWRDHNARKRLKRLVEKIPAFWPWQNTKSILMGPGLGRIAKGVEFDVEEDNNLPELTIASVDLPQHRHIVESLIERGVSIRCTWISTFSEIYKAKSDGLLASNDFCVEDPYIALYNALNPDKPLFFDDGRARKQLEVTQTATDRDSKDAAYRILHKQLLDDAYVIPVLQKWENYYVSNDLNIKNLIGLALWRIGRD